MSVQRQTNDSEFSGLTVQAIGEQGLLSRLQAFCPPEMVGDDAAVLTVAPGRSLVVTADVLVDGVHFSDRTTAPEDAGWRAAAANLSDLAAMGASPLGITVSLGLPGATPVEWVERLYQGLTQCLQPHHTAIVGGDVVRSPVITVSITAFGDADPARLIRRSTAQPGDAIVVTGPHGASRAGLELLLHPDQGAELNEIDRSALIRAHQRPQPRLDVLPFLWKIEREAQSHSSRFDIQHRLTPYSLAGMDSSDGLADAVLQICRASGVGARIDRCQIPIPVALTTWVGPKQALEWALYGGEDFELVLCLPPSAAEELVQQLTGAVMIGTVTAEPHVWLADSTGTEPDVTLSLDRGFQHFL